MFCHGHLMSLTDNHGLRQVVSCARPFGQASWPDTTGWVRVAVGPGEGPEDSQAVE